MTNVLHFFKMRKHLLTFLLSCKFFIDFFKMCAKNIVNNFAISKNVKDVGENDKKLKICKLQTKNCKLCIFSLFSL